MSRALNLLSGIARFPEIAGALSGYGYSQEEHALGWALIAEAGGKNLMVIPHEVTPNVVRDAIAMIDGWDESTFRLASKALLRGHPAQHAFVFEGLKPDTGLGSVLAVQTFLERLTALESSVEREATREADTAALATLASRGINREERERMGELVRLAQSIPTGGGASAEEAAATREEQRKAALIELHFWWDDWAEVARQCISKRLYLRAMGLVTSSPSSSPPPEAPEAPEAPDAPAAEA